MEELVHQNRKQALTNKKNYYKLNIQMMSLSLILPQFSTFNEKGLKPYWNLQCQELQSILWLPEMTDSQGQDLNLYYGLLNYTEEQSVHWKRAQKPKHLGQQNLSVSLPVSAIPIMGKNQKRGIKIAIASKKIRVYPEKKAYLKVLSLYKKAYNFAVANYLNNTYKNGKFKVVLSLNKKTKAIKSKRKITVKQKQILDLNHYKFKIKLKCYANKYEKYIINCNESWISKTKSWNGEIDEKLSSKKLLKEIVLL